MLRDMIIHLTDDAVKHLRELREERGAQDPGYLRIEVEKGGCAGMQYAMSFDGRRGTDHLIEAEDVGVLVDAESARYIEGSTVDYVDDLTGAGFKIRNPRAVRSCGCGTSFETDAAAG